MLKTRRRRLDQRIKAAMQRLATIAASITTLANEGLLDIADIFKAGPHTPLAETAFAGMCRRGISF